MSDYDMFCRVLERLGEERQNAAEISRKALELLDAEIQLTKNSEKICEWASLHHVAVMKLSGVTIPPKNAEELKYWIEMLRKARQVLNSLTG